MLHTAINSIYFSTVGGGSISEAYQIILNNEQRFFCKINSSAAFPQLFAKEKRGLDLLSRQEQIRTPAVIGCEVFQDKQLLILEWIDQATASDSCWKTFGRQLAALHHCHWAGPGGQFQCGWQEDNYMGALQQTNTVSPTWASFFAEHRLEPQVKLAIDNHSLEPGWLTHFTALYAKLREIFSEEPPSLLHGDLWSGNFLCNPQQEPVLIDPAVYYGHRSMDLAMTTLFGGFSRSFYDAYHYHHPLPGNYRQQWEICNLYPLLIHLNLFGKSYLSGILDTIKKW